MLDGEGAKYVVETMWMLNELMEAGLKEVKTGLNGSNMS